MIKYLCDACGAEIKTRSEAGNNRLRAQISQGHAATYVGDFHACNKACLTDVIARKVRDR